MDTNVTIDWSLVQEGVYATDDYMAIMFDGTLFAAGHSEDTDKSFTEMPLYNDKGKELQVLVSEYSINKGFKALSQIGYVNF